MVTSIPTARDGSDLARLLGRFRRSLNRAVRAEIGASPLPEAQSEVLRHVERRPGTSVHRAALELGLAPNTLSTLVHRLVDAGLLEREPDLLDGRVARLRLTAAADDRLRRWRDQRHEILESHLAALAASDRRALSLAIPVLERVVGSLESAWPPARSVLVPLEQGDADDA
ncbi:MAG: MarR family winged helix-turn-helix transcriptional regulator [Candidatus Dormiibacterota bacterium]